MAKISTENGKKQIDKMALGEFTNLLKATNIAEEIRQGDYVPPMAGTETDKPEKVPLLPLYIANIIDDPENSQSVLFIDEGNNPKTNPTSPQFDYAFYKAELAKMQVEIDEAGELASRYLRDSIHKVVESAPDFADTVAGAIADIQTKMPAIIEGITNTLPALLAKVTKLFTETMPNVDWELMPYIADELAKPEYEEIAHQPFDSGALFTHIVATDEQGREYGKIEPTELWLQILADARQAKRQAEAEAGDLPFIDGDKVLTMDLPTDKVNREIWEQTETAEGQFQLALSMANKAADATAIVAVNFDDLPQDLKFTKELTHYDKRVFTAVVSLINMGCRTVTAQNIYYAMGNDSHPNARQLDAIHQSIMKMRKTDVVIDNLKESAATNGNYPLFYRGHFYLLPVDAGEAIQNNKVVKTAYYLPQDEPRLMQFARQHKQITSFSRGVYATPISQSMGNLKLEDYLIDQIAAIKHGSRNNNKITFSAVFAAAGVKQNHYKDTIERIYLCLDHYKSAEAKHFIYDYKKAEDEPNPGVYIIPKKPGDATGKKGNKKR